MNKSEQPTVAQILSMMKKSMNGKLPKAIKLAGKVMPEMVFEHARSNGFSMPKEGGALSDDVRTLIYLGIALATNSNACIDAMMNRAKTLGITKDKILETFKIARFAEATRVFGNAQIVFEHLNDKK